MAVPDDTRRVDTGMITPQLRVLARNPAFRNGVDRLAVHDGTLRGPATQALAIYLRSKNFTLLRTVRLTQSHL